MIVLAQQHSPPPVLVVGSSSSSTTGRRRRQQQQQQAGRSIMISGYNSESCGSTTTTRRRRRTTTTIAYIPLHRRPRTQQQQQYRITKQQQQQQPSQLMIHSDDDDDYGTSCTFAYGYYYSHISKSRRRRRRRRKTSCQTCLFMWSDDDDDENEIDDIGNRIRCCFPYLLPILDGDHFGQYIYERIPPLGLVNDIFLGPLVYWTRTIPFLSLLFFLVLTLGTRFNMNMNRTIRYNAQQAALIDVVLLFPELIASGFQEGDVPRSIAEPCTNFVWYVYTISVLYCIISNLRGKKPNGIPYLSESAEWMVGPF